VAKKLKMVSSGFGKMEFAKCVRVWAKFSSGKKL
jgi:hypothetical protein